MSAQHYNRTFLTPASIAAVRRALTTDIDQWWTKPDSQLNQIGDIAKFTFPPQKSFWTFRLDANTDEKVIWHCVDAMHLHDGVDEQIEKEWLGSELIFKFQIQNDQVKIDFTHFGLHPQLLCYEVCEMGWDFFFVQSLEQYLRTGQGKPHQP